MFLTRGLVGSDFSLPTGGVVVNTCICRSSVKCLQWLPRQQKANTARSLKGVIGAPLKWEKGEKCKKRKKIYGNTSGLKILSIKTQEWCLGLEVL